MSTSQVHVTKLAAAQRQLRAAIRMFFAGEDELAVHTVAAAAYKLIADLKRQRGRDEVGDYYLTSIFYVVRDYRRGSLPNCFTSDPEAMKWIHEMAEQLPITATSKREDFTVSVPAETVREWWSKTNKAANFLKHADRDSTEHISMDEIDNLSLLMQALGSYTDLIEGDLGDEGLTLWIYIHVADGTADLLPPEYQQVAKKLTELEGTEQIKFCASMIHELKEENLPRLADSSGS
jgi:hypothetical protein